MSGLVAARRLADNGFSVRVFDKGRGPGGRMSTRREGIYQFDHGAQYFTVTSGRFRAQVKEWLDEGVVERWEARIAVVEDNRVFGRSSGVNRYVGKPHMNVVNRRLARDADVTLGTVVAAVRREEERWRLIADGGGDLGLYDIALVSVPPVQALPLLAESSGVAQIVGNVSFSPCWTVMAAFDEPINVAWDAAFVHPSYISWAARNNAKPERPDEESWVIHGTAEWSQKHLESTPDAVCAELLGAFFECGGAEAATPAFIKAHRWRYARAVNHLDMDCLWEPSLGIGVCGDWCRGSRVEDAFLSGDALAQRVIDSA